MEYFTYQQTFYIKNQIANANSGYVGVFKYSETPGDTIHTVSDVWQDQEFCLRLCEAQFKMLVGRGYSYVYFELVDLNCSECSKDLKREFIK